MTLPTKSDYLSYFNARRVPNPVAVTLTMKQRIETYDAKGRFGTNIDLIKASKNTRDFMNRINKSVFGNGFVRYGKRLSTIPIIEGNSFIRFHIHMTIERPDHLNQNELGSLIAKCWTQTMFGYHDINIK
jgi:hypothetical protein